MTFHIIDTHLHSLVGLSTDTVFHGAHSLGGIVLQSYISGHAELSAGLVMFGTYLPDLSAAAGDDGDDDNAFPVPVLTAVGSLDGGVMPYVRREIEESQLAEDALGVDGRYPVLVIDRVNHAQVFGGE